MTEEEKKEFEEFLKWKAEKAKNEESSKKDESSNSLVDVVDNSPQKNEVSQDNTGTNQIVNEESSNTWLYIFATIIALVVLFVFVIGFSGKKQSSQPYIETDEEVEVDSVAAIALDDVAPKNYKVTWDFTISKDEMTDSKNIWASITSDNYISQDFPYEGNTRATITVRYMKKYGYDVLIQISQGQMNGRHYYGTDYISARFDENKPKKYYFNESADGDSKVVFLRNSSDFIKNCKKAKDIKIELPLYKGGRPIFTFHVINNYLINFNKLFCTEPVL